MMKLLSRRRRVLLIVTTACASFTVTLFLWLVRSPVHPLLSYLVLPHSGHVVRFFSGTSAASKTLAQPPRKPRQLSVSDTSTTSLTSNDVESESAMSPDSFTQRTAAKHNLLPHFDKQYPKSISRAGKDWRQKQKYYWIVTHFRSGSTLLSTMLSIPQQNTIFLFEPLHFLQSSFLIALRNFYNSTPQYSRSNTYNFTTMLAAVNILHFANTSNSPRGLSTSNATISTSSEMFGRSDLADSSISNENSALLRAVAPSTADLRRLSMRLIQDILQCHIVDSPEARVYYLTDGFVNFDPNLAQLKARWRRDDPSYYLQQVEQACRQAKRIVLKTIRADLRLVLDVVTTLRDLYETNIHVVHLWRHPMASVNSAYGRTGVRPFVRWVRMFCQVLYSEDYMVFDIVRQQLNNKNAQGQPHTLPGVESNSSVTTNSYTRIFYEDLITRQRRDQHTLLALLSALGVDVTRDHQKFIDNNFNSGCEPERPGARRRDQGSFALCRTKTFDPHHWRMRKNQAQLKEWMQACRPAIDFYEAEIGYWQQFGKDRPHGFYPV